MIFYCQKEMNPLKVEISKFLFDESNKEKMEEYNKFTLMQFKNTKMKEKVKHKKFKNSKKKKVNYPPKKQSAKIVSKYSTGEKYKQTETSSSKGDVLENDNKINKKEKKGKIPNKSGKNKPRIKKRR